MKQLILDLLGVGQQSPQAAEKMLADGANGTVRSAWSQAPLLNTVARILYLGLTLVGVTR